MKKNYEELKFELLLFAAQDVVTLSENGKDDVGDDIFGPNN